MTVSSQVWNVQKAFALIGIATSSKHGRKELMLKGKFAPNGEETCSMFVQRKLAHLTSPTRQCLMCHNRMGGICFGWTVGSPLWRLEVKCSLLTWGRILTPAELFKLMGFPPTYHLDQFDERTQLTFVGNTMHVSVVGVLLSILQAMRSPGAANPDLPF